MSISIAGGNSKLKLIDLTSSGNIASSGEETITLQPTAGFIYKIKALHFKAIDPAGSSAGTHEVQFNLNNGTDYISVCICRGNTGSAVQIGSANGSGTNRWEFSGNATEQPDADLEQMQLFFTGNLMCSYSIPLELLYKNDTDVTQAGDRIVIVLVEEIPERL